MEDVSTKFYKKLSNCDDIIEIRAQIGKNNFRLLGFENKGTLVILTNGFKKKDQKILKSEITLVEKRKKEYLSRGD
ncbi:type II toxin-antitoxin system RelE/ParE family toxin [Sulfurimonas sp. SAG-AH-194-L11]|nr:type II toxin-antitoxin system RelE/ParE family toxin [Sulfurimonas sp. SAG-AH-194-L11]